MTILELMKQRKITQGEIAKHIGVTQGTMHNYFMKYGVAKMPFEKAIMMCDFIGISKQEFIKGNIKPLKGRR